MTRLFWMHTDTLCEPPCEAVFVFDDEQIDEAQWGLKRLMFIYECLLELQVEIHRGPTVATLLRIAEARAATLVTVDSPDPWIRQQFGRLPIEVLPAPQLVSLPEPVDLKRFARYWKRAEPKLLS